MTTSIVDVKSGISLYFITQFDLITFDQSDFTNLSLASYAKDG